MIYKCKIIHVALFNQVNLLLFIVSDYFRLNICISDRLHIMYIMNIQMYIKYTIIRLFVFSIID